MSTLKVDKLQGTSGSATALTLNGAASTFNGVHTVGNNAIYTSDGGAVTQNLVQGLAKAWFNVNQTGTQAFRDNFNFSSITDVVLGGTKLAFTNPFSSEGYAAGNMAKPADAGGYAILRMSEPVSTTEFQFLGEDSNDTNTDCHTATGMMTGDLA